MLRHTRVTLAANMGHHEEMTVQQAIRKFGTNTTLHGVPRIARSRSVCKKVFWLLVFISAFTVFGYQLSQLLKKYFTYEKRFNVELRKESAQFPLITVCDMRPFDILTLRDVYSVFSLRSDVSKAAAMATGNEFITRLLTFHDDISAIINNLEKNKETKPYASVLDDIWSPSLLLDINQTVVDKGGTKLEDFFVACEDSIAKNSCSTAQFQTRSLLFDGVFLSRCFTYDVSNSESGRLPRKHVSPRNRLEWAAALLDGHGMLPLFEASRKVARHVDKLFDRALGRSGVEVYIHPRGTQPNLISQEKFVYVPPGHVANILVNQRNTVLLGQPYGRCRDSYPFRPHPQGPYLRTACYYACLQNAVVNTCGCKSAELSNADEYPNFAYCFSLSKILAAKSPQEIAVALAHVNQSRVCESEILDTDPSHIICEQECPRACEETSYDLDVRLIRWPKRNTIVHHLAEKFMTDLQANNATERFDLYRNHYEFVVNESDPSNFERFNYETLVNELTILNVEMKSGDLTVTSEAPDYSLYQLLSDIGGQLGLWIGMSVITVTEILELILDLTKLAIKRCTESSAPRRMSTNSASIS